MTSTAVSGRAIRTVFSLAVHSALAPTSTTTISQNGVAASTATTAPAMEPSKLPWVSVVMVRPLAVVALEEPSETEAMEPMTNVTTNRATASNPTTAEGNQAREVNRRRGATPGAGRPLYASSATAVAGPTSLSAERTSASVRRCPPAWSRCAHALPRPPPSARPVRGCAGARRGREGSGQRAGASDPAAGSCLLSRTAERGVHRVAEHLPRAPELLQRCGSCRGERVVATRRTLGRLLPTRTDPTGLAQPGQQRVERALAGHQHPVCRELPSDVEPVAFSARQQRKHAVLERTPSEVTQLTVVTEYHAA